MLLLIGWNLLYSTPAFAQYTSSPLQATTVTTTLIYGMQAYTTTDTGTSFGVELRYNGGTNDSISQLATANTSVAGDIYGPVPKTLGVNVTSYTVLVAIVADYTLTAGGFSYGSGKWIASTNNLSLIVSPSTGQQTLSQTSSPVYITVTINSTGHGTLFGASCLIAQCQGGFSGPAFGGVSVHAANLRVLNIQGPHNTPH